MKILFVRGEHPPPADLLALIEQGSTSMDVVSTNELPGLTAPAHPGADRIVFWAADSDPAVRSRASEYGRGLGIESRQRVFYVTVSDREQPPEGLGRESVFVWPRDLDGLKMAFMTGG